MDATDKDKMAKGTEAGSTQPTEEKIPALEIYKAQHAHFGRMNEILYKLPTIYAALIGGLWFFAYSALTTAPTVSVIIFAFAAVVCRYSVTFASRWRLALNGYLNQLNEFEGAHAVTLQTPEQKNNPKANRPLSSIRALARTLWWAFALSIGASLYAAGAVFCKFSACALCAVYR
jgi:hypothetical protein